MSVTLPLARFYSLLTARQMIVRRIEDMSDRRVRWTRAEIERRTCICWQQPANNSQLLRGNEEA